MAVILDGKAVSAKVKEEVKEEVEALKKQGVSVGLAVIIVGNNPASRTYVNNKKKACEAAGILSEEYALPEETTQEELLALVEELNHKDSINGILCQLPLPKQLDEEAVIAAISEKKEGRLLFCDNKPCGVMAVSPREYTHNVDYVCTWPTEPNKKAPFGAQILFAEMFRNFLETSANIIELTATRFGNAITKYLALGFKPCGGDNYTEIMRITRERVNKRCENLDKKFQLVPSNDHRDLDLFTVLKSGTSLNP